MKAEIHDLRMKMAQEDKETRSRLDVVKVEMENLGQSIKEIKALLTPP